MTNPPGPEDIIAAASRIKPYIHRTPSLRCKNLDELTGASLVFKCENFQKAGAFKSRGAVNAVFSLDEEELKNGVCTHSSGNHAQALARAAALRNTIAYIVMPENSPRAKVEAVISYGGRITFCTPNLAARESTLQQITERYGATEIHPYNNYTIIAGQATAAMELFEDEGEPDYIIAPVGGGGLMSGTSLSAKYFTKNTIPIGAEPKNADDAWRSFNSRTLQPSENPNTIADGLLTSLGSLTFPLILENVSDILCVTEESIKLAMKLIWERMKIITEPSACVPLAAILENKDFFSGKTVGLIVSGGNLDLGNIPWNKNTVS